jgi:hypothetical protein
MFRSFIYATIQQICEKKIKLTVTHLIKKLSPFVKAEDSSVGSQGL